jgi:hypothetical protein
MKYIYILQHAAYISAKRRLLTAFENLYVFLAQISKV